MRLLPAFAPALSLVIATAAVAGTSYTGNWPFTVSGSEYNNGSHCLVLTDNGSDGWPHSGSAVLDSQEDGTFQLIGKTLLVMIDDEGSYMNASTVISARAGSGNIGAGAFTEVYDGPSIDSGKVVFGTKGGC